MASMTVSASLVGRGLPSRSTSALRPRPRTTLSGLSGFMGAALCVPRSAVSAGNARSSRIVTHASLFGVGAPEAVLVGVVALVVFGPKGLAEAAKSLGSTLRAFQPTLRELTSVSNDLKNTLEEEIGLDEIKRDLRGYPPVPEPKPSTASSSASAKADGAAADPQLQAMTEDQAKMLDPTIESKRAASAEEAWGTKPPSVPVAPDAPPAAPKEVTAMSMEELEAEIARRKAAEATASVPKELKSKE